MAILLCLLLGTTLVVPCNNLPAERVENGADSDKGKEVQLEKKDTKEFLALGTKNGVAASQAVGYPAGTNPYSLPQPTFQILKPPPDVIC